jgi:uncharacterized protein YbcI
MFDLCKLAARSGASALGDLNMSAFPKRPNADAEAGLVKVLTSFLKKKLGRGASHGKAYIVHDLVILHTSGVLHPAEQVIAKQAEHSHLVPCMRTLRHEFLNACRQELQALMEPILKVPIVSLFSDLDVSRDEAVLVMRFERAVARK